MITCPLNYEDCERAQLLSDLQEESENCLDQMPKKGRRRKATTGVKKRRSSGHTRRKVRVVRGLVSIKVPGHKSIQHIRASELIRHIPLIKIRVAAKRVLGRSHRKLRRVKRRRRGKTRKLRRRRHSRRKRRVAK